MDLASSTNYHQAAKMGRATRSPPVSEKCDHLICAAAAGCTRPRGGLDPARAVSRDPGDNRLAPRRKVYVLSFPRLAIAIGIQIRAAAAAEKIRSPRILCAK